MVGTEVVGNIVDGEAEVRATVDGDAVVGATVVGAAVVGAIVADNGHAPLTRYRLITVADFRQNQYGLVSDGSTDGTRTEAWRLDLDTTLEPKHQLACSHRAKHNMIAQHGPARINPGMKKRRNRSCASRHVAKVAVHTRRTGTSRI